MNNLEFALCVMQQCEYNAKQECERRLQQGSGGYNKEAPPTRIEVPLTA